MKLNINEPELQARIRSHIRHVDKKLLDKVIATKVDKVDSLIVLGNGNEDARVVSLLYHHLDGEKVVDVIKPELKRHAALRKLKEYDYMKKYERIAFVFDQEADNLDKLIGGAEDMLSDVGITIVKREKFSNRRVRSYDCSMGGHVFRLVVVVNGLDDVGGHSHMIEDHLVSLAGVAVQESSKDVWDNLDKDKKHEIYGRIHGSREIAEKIFSQHFIGLSMLDC